MSTRGSRARHAATYRHGAGYQPMTTDERRLQQAIFSQREPHRWGRGDQIELGQERVVITGVHWNGNVAGYELKRPGQPGWKRMSQAELIQRTEKITVEEPSHHRHRHRDKDTRTAALTAKIVPQQCEGGLSGKTSWLEALRPPYSNWLTVAPGHWIPLPGAGLRYVQ